MDQFAEAAALGLQARGIRKLYGDRTVLDDLTLSVAPGEALGLLGANGSGKTTLIKVLLGLLAHEGGAATIAGEASSSLSAAVRERIGYVPQQPSQFEWLNGRAMLAYVSAFYSRFDREYAHGLLERWKVSLRTPISALSPGQQQRLSLVRALAPRPDLIVLDEPIASLDPATRIAVIDELNAERNRRKLTILFSSHITGDLQRLCTHFAVLAKGKVALLETTDVLKARAAAESKDFEGMLSEHML